MPNLFCKKEKNPDAENCKGQKPVVVFPEPMAQCISAHQESQSYHAIFKKGISDNIKAKNRQTGQQ